MIIGQIREDKIARLENLMDGILSAEEFRDDELASLKNENKVWMPIFPSFLTFVCVICPRIDSLFMSYRF